MDSIDITDPEFSLGGFSEVNDVISDTINITNGNSYTIYIYFGILFLLLTMLYFAYNYYNKPKHVTFDENNVNCNNNVCQR